LLEDIFAKHIMNPKYDIEIIYTGLPSPRL
jgi:hypothetical protein